MATKGDVEMAFDNLFLLGNIKNEQITKYNQTGNKKHNQKKTSSKIDVIDFQHFRWSNRSHDCSFTHEHYGT